jgi:hypothetical protein
MWYEMQRFPIPQPRLIAIGVAAAVAVGLSAVTFWLPMKRGIQALEALAGGPRQA